MRILLVGEYSRLHNSLKEGLQALGHEVTLVGSGDGFKKFPVDIELHRGFESGWRKKLKLAILKFSGIDISEIALRQKFEALKPKLSGYDVVQLINESSFHTTPRLELEIAQYLKQNNKKIFLLSCGTDHISVKHALSDELPYTIATPYKEGKLNDETFAAALKYLKPSYTSLHQELYKIIDGVIATDLDYHVPLKSHPKYLGLIPNPINVDGIPYKNLEKLKPIVIFHGINRSNYYKKGNDLFETALKKIENTYGSKVRIITSQNLPYHEYIRKYRTAHIILDQVYAHDQGYNALESMARGKVVFTGAGTLFKEYYNLENQVAIDATPDVDTIYDDLSTLILSPEKITAIGKNAREFIEQYHHYKNIAQKYISTWGEEATS